MNINAIPRFYRFILSFCSISICLSLNAKKIELNEAQRVAQSFLEQQPEVVSVQAKMLSPVSAEESGNVQRALSQEEKPYYIFNRGNEQGFIIVSANDIATPVLGYSDNGSYDPDNLPPNFKAWMDGVAATILQGIEDGLSAGPEISAQWETYLNETETLPAEPRMSNLPLLMPTWGQDSPFNAQCPMDGASRSITGCVATAMAQIMKYYEYPAQGPAKTIPGYVTETKKINVPAISASPATTYNWKNMQLNYSSGAEAPDVATIMHHCGVSIKMDYTATVSGAYDYTAAYAFSSYFDYDKNLEMEYRRHYTDAQWIALLKAEIDAGRPMYYSGVDETANSGHAFICDGYNNDDIHINWGWSGKYDGYYAVGILDVSGYKFNRDNLIFTGIKPDPSGTSTYRYKLDLQRGTGITATKNSVVHSETFNVTARFYNSGYVSLPLGSSVCVALFDAGNQFAGLVVNSTDVSLAPNVGANRTFSNCRIPTEALSGNYTLRIVWRAAGTTDWIVAKADQGYVGELPLAVTTSAYIITASAGKGGTVTPSGMVVVNQAGNQTFTIVPDTGYAIETVLVDGTNRPEAVNAGSYTFSDVTSGHTIAATFKLKTYIITASAGAGGIISPNGSAAVSYGGSKTYTIKPNSGYVIETVLIDGKNIPEAISAGSYTFKNVADDHSIAATFKPKIYTITASAGMGGVISPSGNVPVSPGDNQIFIITPNEGFAISGIQIDGEHIGIVESYTFTEVVDNHSIEVSFSPKDGVNESLTPLLKLYPNPVEDELVIDSDELIIDRIRVADMTGRIIDAVQSEAACFRLATNHYFPGIYLIFVTRGDETTVHRMIKK